MGETLSPFTPSRVYGPRRPGGGWLKDGESTCRWLKGDQRSPADNQGSRTHFAPGPVYLAKFWREQWDAYGKTGRTALKTCTEWLRAGESARRESTSPLNMDVSCPIKTFLFQETDLLAFALISYRTAFSSSTTELNQLRGGGLCFLGAVTDPHTWVCALCLQLFWVHSSR